MALTTHYAALKLPLIPDSYYKLIVVSAWEWRARTEREKGHVGLPPLLFHPATLLHLSGILAGYTLSLLLALSSPFIPPFPLLLLLFPLLHSLSFVEVWITFKTTCSCVWATEPYSLQAGNVTVEWDWSAHRRDRHARLPDGLARTGGWRILDVSPWRILQTHILCDTSGSVETLGQIWPVQDWWQHQGVVLIRKNHTKPKEKTEKLFLSQVLS